MCRQFEYVYRCNVYERDNKLCYGRITREGLILDSGFKQGALLLLLLLCDAVFSFIQPVAHTVYTNKRFYGIFLLDIKRKLLLLQNFYTLIHNICI